jgi:hypothetical protein
MPKYRNIELGTEEGDVGVGDLPFIKVNRSTSDSYTLVTETPGGSASYANGRVYSTNSAKVFTQNARFNNVGVYWEPDISGVLTSAALLQLTNQGLELYAVDTSGVSNWNSWTDPGGSFRVYPRGVAPYMRLYSQGTGATGAELELRGPATSSDLSHLKINKSNPIYNNGSVEANCVYSANIVKVWVSFLTSAGPSVNNMDGFGVASYSFPDATTFQINFTNAMSNIHYSVFGSVDGLAFLYVSLRTTTYVQVKFRYSDDSADVNFGTYIRTYSVTIIGKQ